MWVTGGITLIPVFDNAVVCELIEGRRPAGIFATLNDATATAHADPAAADNSFIQRSGMLSASPNFESRGNKFLIKHYAGDVLYNVPGMTDKNKDLLVKDILDLIESSKDTFLHTLFPEKVDHDSKKRPPTAGDKIRVCAGDTLSSHPAIRQRPRHQPDAVSGVISTPLRPGANPTTSARSSRTRIARRLSMTTRRFCIRSSIWVFKRTSASVEPVLHTVPSSPR